ncbi:MAG: leucine-rich repeat protein [Muribaculaceae bacterium]
MKLFTLNLRKAMAGLAICLTVMGASGATVDYQGITYTIGTGAKKGQLTIAKPSAAIAAEGGYKGDIVIPDNPVTIDGETYTITSVAATAFKGNTEITSVYFPDGCVNFAQQQFLNCTALKSVRYPADLTKFSNYLFYGCTSLEELIIPGSVTTLASDLITSCTSLKKITIEAGETALSWDVAAVLRLDEVLNDDNTVKYAQVPLETIEIHRNIVGFNQPATVPFRGCKTLKNVIIGDEVTEIYPYYFENCTALENVTMGANVTTIGGNCFANTAISSFTTPSGITSILGSTFQNCPNLTTVTLNEGLTSIQEMAFYNSPVANINFPSTLTNIGGYAFANAKIADELVLPENLATIGVQAFANNVFTKVIIPASVTSIGDAAFLLCRNLNAFEVAADNAAYSVMLGTTLQTKDGDKIVAYAIANESDGVGFLLATKVAPHAFHGATNLKSLDLPKVTEYGDYSLAETSVTSQELHGTIGRYVLQNCKSLKEVKVVNNREIPLGLCDGCANLESYIWTIEPTIVKQAAFRGATSLKSLDLGSILVIIEADAFKDSGIEELKVRSTYPSSLAEGVFTADMSAIKVYVPNSLVETYKAAEGWSYLTIVGDENLVAGGEKIGMPAGLYYASPDGMLRCAYADGAADEYEVGGLKHTFQLVQFKNRIYGASAGEKFVYSATGAVEGDGKLFYISQIDGNVFQAVVLDNAGGNAYKDPFNLYIYGSTLYVNDRNVCIRKIAAEAIALDINYPSWVENTWLGYYGAPWAYGCIKCGFAITEDKDTDGNPEPLYWVGMKYNGNGIFNFKESDINTSSPVKPSFPTMLTTLNPIFTTFNIDSKNGYLYLYIEKAGNPASWASSNVVECGPGEDGTIIKGGLYRVKLEDLAANPDPNYEKFKEIFELVDGSPVHYEGSGASEHVGISQLSIDDNGEYMYWCYRAPTEADVEAQSNYAYQSGGRYPWAEAYDETNPLHKSGIKRIKLSDPEPKVEMVVEGVEGYGVVAVNYEGSTKPEGGVEMLPADDNDNDRIIISGDSFTLTQDAVVTIYTLSGVALSQDKVAAHVNNTLNGNTTGVYVIEARFADGAKQVAKVAIK